MTTNPSEMPKRHSPRSSEEPERGAGHRTGLRSAGRRMPEAREPGRRGLEILADPDEVQRVYRGHPRDRRLRGPSWADPGRINRRHRTTRRATRRARVLHPDLDRSDAEGRGT